MTTIKHPNLQEAAAKQRRAFLVRELLMPLPPKSPATADQIARFKAAKPRPKNKGKPRGRHVDARNVDEVMHGLREQYQTGPYQIRSMNAAPARDRDQARAVVLVYLQPRRR